MAGLRRCDSPPHAGETGIKKVYSRGGPTNSMSCISSQFQNIHLNSDILKTPG